MADEIMVALEKEIQNIMDKIFTTSQENIVFMNISDTGFLLKSGSMQGQGFDTEIVYNTPYAEHIEFGTDPHFVPVKAIEGWVRRKLSITNPKENKRVAFLIARKIQQQGTRPKPFMRNAIDKTIAQL